MAKGDLDGDGLINLQEFIEYVKAQEEDLLTLFKKLDLNGDGYVHVSVVPDHPASPCSE